MFCPQLPKHCNNTKCSFCVVFFSAVRTNRKWQSYSGPVRGRLVLNGRFREGQALLQSDKGRAETVGCQQSPGNRLHVRKVKKIRGRVVEGKGTLVTLKLKGQLEVTQG